MLAQSYTRVSEDASNASSGSIDVSEPDETWAFRQEFILIGKVTLTVFVKGVVSRIVSLNNIEQLVFDLLFKENICWGRNYE